MPIGTNLVPASTIKTLQDAQSVQVPANSPVSAPDPSWSLVVMVATIKMPI